VTLTFIYWFSVLLILLFGSWTVYNPPTGRFGSAGWFLLLLVLIVIGLKLFGFPIQGQ
jgi:hypothetical protein